MQDNPTLSREHIDKVRSVAQLRSVRSGEILYKPSHPDVPLFIVLEGTVSITRAGEDEKVLAVREQGQFTGEMSVISGSRSLLTARVTNDGVVLELTRDKVLSLMAKDTELGDILMGAFVARRLLMIQLGEGNVILFGTKSSARTLAIREFLTRNGHPFAYIDIDSDNCASELMEQLAVRNSEIQVLYCNRRYVLRNPSIAELAACLDLNINVDKGVRDVLVIGAGPGGLAAAVYAASEGLKTLVVEKSAPGGPGRIEFEDRELPGLPDRTFRTGTCKSIYRSSSEVWRSVDGCPIGRAHRLQPAAIQDCSGIWPEVQCAQRSDCDRGSIRAPSG
jgi:thioredoxin reductase (NADPH)